MSKIEELKIEELKIKKPTEDEKIDPNSPILPVLCQALVNMLEIAATSEILNRYQNGFNPSPSQKKQIETAYEILIKNRQNSLLLLLKIDRCIPPSNPLNSENGHIGYMRTPPYTFFSADIWNVLMGTYLRLKSRQAEKGLDLSKKLKSKLLSYSNEVSSTIRYFDYVYSLPPELVLKLTKDISFLDCWNIFARLESARIVNTTNSPENPNNSNRGSLFNLIRGFFSITKSSQVQDIEYLKGLQQNPELQSDFFKFVYILNNYAADLKIEVILKKFIATLKFLVSLDMDEETDNHPGLSEFLANYGHVELFRKLWKETDSEPCSDYDFYKLVEDYIKIHYQIQISPWHVAELGLPQINQISTPTTLKRIESALAKIQRGHPITDLLRNFRKFEFPQVIPKKQRACYLSQQVKRFINNLLQNLPKVSQIEIKPALNLSGYCDLKIIIYYDSQQIELQVNTPQMSEAKDKEDLAYSLRKKSVTTLSELLKPSGLVNEDKLRDTSEELLSALDYMENTSPSFSLIPELSINEKDELSQIIHYLNILEKDKKNLLVLALRNYQLSSAWGFSIFESIPNEFRIFLSAEEINEFTDLIEEKEKVQINSKKITQLYEKRKYALEKSFSVVLNNLRSCNLTFPDLDFQISDFFGESGFTDLGIYSILYCIVTDNNRDILFSLKQDLVSSNMNETHSWLNEYNKKSKAFLNRLNQLGINQKKGLSKLILDLQETIGNNQIYTDYLENRS